MDGDEKAWPYFVLICRVCDQIGMMRWRRFCDAKKYADLIANTENLVCIVFGKDNREKYRAGPSQEQVLACRIALKTSGG